MSFERTKFGSELRRMRLQRDEILGETAGAIGISTAMLSAVETGRKPASERLIDSLANHFGLSNEETERLLDLAQSSRESVRLDLNEVTSQHRDTAAVFARRFPKLTEEELERIRRVLEPEEKSD